MITWPVSLPNPDRDFSARVSSPFIRTQMDSGRFRQRVRFTRDLRATNVVWTFSDEEYTFFQGVYRHLLNSGADWFTINLPFGDGLRPFTARFTSGGYDAKHDGVMYWRVRATLETEDDSALSAESTDAIVAVGSDVSEFELVVATLTEITEL